MAIKKLQVIRKRNYCGGGITCAAAMHERLPNDAARRMVDRDLRHPGRTVPTLGDTCRSKNDIMRRLVDRQFRVIATPVSLSPGKLRTGCMTMPQLVVSTLDFARPRLRSVPFDSMQFPQANPARSPQGGGFRGGGFRISEMRITRQIDTLMPLLMQKFFNGEVFRRVVVRQGGDVFANLNSCMISSIEATTVQATLILVFDSVSFPSS